MTPGEYWRLQLQRTMTGFLYSDYSEVPHAFLATSHCPFCKHILHRVFEETRSEDSPPVTFTSATRILYGCNACGWWKAVEEKSEADDFNLLAFRSSAAPDDATSYTQSVRRISAGALRAFNLSDQSIPLHEIRDFLMAKYEHRFQLNPKLFEDVVCSVFSTIGFTAVVTGRSGDGGIDVILQKDDVQIGVQVKRYKNAIEVEQIRALSGALTLNGLAHGIFVTTSRFQRGANRTVSILAARGQRIELLDAKRFYEALSIAQGAVNRTWPPESIALCFRQSARVALQFQYYDKDHRPLTGQPHDAGVFQGPFDVIYRDEAEMLSKWHDAGFP